MKRVAGLAAAASVVLLLAGCTAAPDADPTTPASQTASAAPSPSATAPGPSAAAEAPTCETLIAPETVTAFQDLGWESRQEPFMIVADEIEGGLMCKWGDPNGSGEGLQIFGWAPISDTQADAAQADLLANGWETIDTDEGTFLTEGLDTAFATGAQGYGLTYQFGPGWVIFADTKQSLLLIRRPGA